MGIGDWGNLGTGHWSACTNVYSINPIRQLAVAVAVPTSASASTSAVCRHSPFKTSRWNFLVRAWHRFRLCPGSSFQCLASASCAAALRPLIMIMEATLDHDSPLATLCSQLAARSSSPIAFVYDRMLGSSVDFLINARILRSVPSATATEFLCCFSAAVRSACN